MDDLCSAIPVVGSQSAFLLLSKCVSFCRFVYNARTVHPSLFHDFALEFDELVLECFSAIVPGIRREVLEQVKLPIRLGGLGLRRLSDHCIAAFLSSTKEAATYLKWKWEEIYPQWKLEELLTSHNNNWSVEQPVTWEQVNAQRQLSEVIDKQQLIEFTLHIPERQLKQFSCLNGEVSNGWLTAMPCRENRLRNEVFETAIRLRLNVDVYEAERRCEVCDTGDVIDLKGIHSISCSGGSDRTIRHNTIRDILGNLCSQAGWAPQLEKNIF